MEHDGVALEERVRPARRVEQRRDRRVGALERDVVGAGRTVRVRREVEVGEVEREEVEAVARDEPAPDRRGVRVERAGRAVAHGERRPGQIRLEQAVEEEPLRPERGLRHPRQRRRVTRAPAVAGDVHRGRDEPRVLERLEHRHGVLAEMLLVHVVDRVRERLRHAGGAHGGERRAVLDDPPLAAVPPDEVRDPVHVGTGAGDDRGEADRRERREHGGRAPVDAVLGEIRERGRAAALDGALERGGRHPVDDDEDDFLRRPLLSRGRASAARRACPASGAGGGRPASGARAPRGSRPPARARARRG